MIGRYCYELSPAGAQQLRRFLDLLPALDPQRLRDTDPRTRLSLDSGAVPKKIPQADPQRVFRDVADYARTACLIWMQVKTHHQHNDITSVLDGRCLQRTSCVFCFCMKRLIRSLARYFPITRSTRILVARSGLMHRRCGCGL